MKVIEIRGVPQSLRRDGWWLDAEKRLDEAAVLRRVVSKQDVGK